MPKKSCTHPLCPNYSEPNSSYCSDHKPKTQQRYDADKQKMYKSSRWQFIRTRTLRNDPRCQACLLHNKINPAVDVDHIVPHNGSKDIFNDNSCLQGLCKSCHSHKTNLEMQGIIQDYFNNCSYDTHTNTATRIVDSGKSFSHRIEKWLPTWRHNKKKTA